MQLESLVQGSAVAFCRTSYLGDLLNFTSLYFLVGARVYRSGYRHRYSQDFFLPLCLLGIFRFRVKVRIEALQKRGALTYSGFSYRFSLIASIEGNVPLQCRIKLPVGNLE